MTSPIKKRVVPYYEKSGDWLQEPFIIFRQEMSVPVEVTEQPEFTLPKYGFVFLLEGEMLVDADSRSYLLQGGQFFLIPAGVPFTIHYFKDIVGYHGLFELSFLKDVTYPCIESGKPVVQTYWFDSAAFVGQLMDRMVASYACGDLGFVSRAFDLILYSIFSPGDWKAHPLVKRFMKMIFDRSQVLDSVSGYASRLEISPSYLNKLVRTQTRHSAMDWVEIARVNWAKALLKDRSVPVSEVSYAIGIDDPSYFTRFFRKATGQTPSEYRRQIEREQENR